MARLNYTTVDRNGYKYLCYRVRDENGKYVPVYAKTAKELEKKVHLREKEIQLRIKIKEFPTFSEYATVWLSEKSGDIKCNTFDNYKQIIQTHFVPLLGEKRLVDIENKDIKNAMKKPRQQSASVQKKAIMLLKEIFRSALDEGLIQTDPTTKIKYVRRVEDEDEIDIDTQYLTDEQINILLEAVKGIYPLETFIRLGLYAGLRREESLALQWDCVDLNADAPQIEVARTSIFRHNRPEITDGTKTAAGHRSIPIPTPLFNHLKEIKKSVSSDFVICNRKGLPLSETQFRNMWRKIKRRSVGTDEYVRYNQCGKKAYPVKREAGQAAAHNPGVRYTINFPVKTHMLRKTYITNLIYKGVDVRTVMTYAGHKNPDITLKIYAQAKTAEKRAESAKQINEVFPSDPTT